MGKDVIWCCVYKVHKSDLSKAAHTIFNELNSNIKSVELIPIASFQLCKARTELENRITEHDHGVVEGFAKPEVTLQVRCTIL